MSRLRALHHVRLAIPPDGEDACRAFWSGLLGCDEVEKPVELADRGGCWFRAGAVELHLGVDADFRPSATAHPGIVVDDLPGLARRLEAAGVEVSWDGTFPGFERFYWADPFGNRLEFMAPVADPA